MEKQILSVIAIFSFMNVSAQKFEQLAKTPPMGWNSWNKFGCNVSESLIMQTADAMVSSGMADVGYEYVVIDDCWQIGWDENGEIIADPERFPHDIKYLANYIHSKVGLLNQDSLGKQGFCYRSNGGYEIWIKKLANDEKAVCLFNRSDEIKSVQVDFALLLKAHNDYRHPDSFQLKDYKVRDLRKHSSVDISEPVQYAKILPHSSVIYKFIKH